MSTRAGVVPSQSGSKAAAGYESDARAHVLDRGVEWERQWGGPEKLVTGLCSGHGVSCDARWVIVGRAGYYAGAWERPRFTSEPSKPPDGCLGGFGLKPNYGSGNN